MIEIHILGEKIFSTSPHAFSLQEESWFGEKKEGKVEYSLLEAVFLVSQRKALIISNKKQVTAIELIKKAKKNDKRTEIKSTVYSDLRRKGYIVKSALKYGADFRVYNKGVKPSEDHARWIVFATNENEKINWQDFAAKNRIAHSTKKNLLLAIVDQESDVSYYEISWLRP